MSRQFYSSKFTDRLEQNFERFLTDTAVVLRKSVTKDGFGSDVETYVESSRVPCKKVRDKKMTAIERASQPTAKDTWQFTVMNDADILKSDRIQTLSDEVTHEITGDIGIGTHKTTIQFYAKQV